MMQLPLLLLLLLADLPLGLVLIRQNALVGHLPGNHKVYKITKIAVIPLSDEEPQELELEVCILMLWWDMRSSVHVLVFQLLHSAPLDNHYYSACENPKLLFNVPKNTLYASVCESSYDGLTVVQNDL